MIDVVCLTEHWMTESAIDSVSFSNFDIAASFCRQIYKHGGVLIAVKNTIRSEKLDIQKNCSEKIIEVAAVALPDLRIIIVSVYRSPTGCYETFRNSLDNIVRALFENYDDHEIVIAGDFNINFTVKSVERDDISTVQTFGLTPVFNEVSRVGRDSNTCIDNIFIHYQRESYKAKTINAHISDHFGQIITLPISPTRQKENPQKIRIVNQWATDRFVKRSRDISWGLGSPEYTNFHATLCSIVNKFLPLRERKVRDENRGQIRQWHTEEIKQHKNVLSALHVIYSVRKDQETLRVYNECKQHYKELLLKTKQQHHNQYLHESNNKQKAVWTIIKNECRLHKNRNKQHTEDIQITADDFNEVIVDPQLAKE